MSANNQSPFPGRRIYQSFQPFLALFDTAPEAAENELYASDIPSIWMRPSAIVPRYSFEKYVKRHFVPSGGKLELPG